MLELQGGGNHFLIRITAASARGSRASFRVGQELRLHEIDKALQARL